jgi:hypothetical protein
MERYVMLLDKTNMMVWGSIQKLTSNLNLRDVLGISLGMGSSTLRRAYCAEDHHAQKIIIRFPNSQTVGDSTIFVFPEWLSFIFGAQVETLPH